ncbi:amidohydrolase family protein [Nocardia carnea]|uniref:amidohydrolase family protein n=1 Tax=Nocardia carnea TaxID=37328 RepID=UPI0024543894|nr:amidohydrolase family protein [Nocardia carnea]
MPHLLPQNEPDPLPQRERISARRAPERPAHLGTAYPAGGSDTTGTGGTAVIQAPVGSAAPSTSAAAPYGSSATANSRPGSRTDSVAGTAANRLPGTTGAATRRSAGDCGPNSGARSLRSGPAAPADSSRADLLLRNAHIDDAAPLVDIAVTGGVITAIGPDLADTAEQEIDCAARVVIPGLVESHVHLDKALLDRERSGDGTLARAIAVTAELKRDFTAASIRDRARRVLEQAIMHGTTVIRAHPDVDPIVGLLGVGTLLELRDEFRGRIDLQIVAFPQEGILRAPGTLALLREALNAGADVIGGCTYNEDSVAQCRRHIDLVFDLAAEFGVPVDLHADFADDTTDPRFALADYIAEVTERTGMGGRVTIGHATSLAARPPADRQRVLRRLAEAGVAVVPLPATDIFLGGRTDTANIRRGIAPVRELWAAGVRTAVSSNNIRNAFTPYGNADLLDIGLFLAQTSHLAGPGDLTRVLGMATYEAAAVIGIADRYGLRVGADADLVVLSTHRVADALLDRPDRCFVIKAGRIVAHTTRTQRLLPALHL